MYVHVHSHTNTYKYIQTHTKKIYNYLVIFHCLRSLSKKITCNNCVNALHSPDGSAHPFVDLVDRGKLTRPSKSAVTVCLESERVIQMLLKSAGKSLPRGSGLRDTVAKEVLENTADKHLFDELLEHQFDVAVEDNHTHLLVKRIASFFTR